MTEIHGFIKPTKRPGELGVHSLDHFHFVVPDLAVAKDFYSEFGLTVSERGGKLQLAAAASSHVWVTIGEGPRKKFQYLSFGLFEEDFQPFADRLQVLGVARFDPPPGEESNGLWFRDPDGNLIEVKVGPKVSPNEKSAFSMTSAGPGERGQVVRSKMARTQPRRLSHVLLFTPDVARAIAFYRRVIGLRLSDRSGEDIAFMHGIHGSDHHMVAFARSSAPGLHHCSWDVGSINDIGAGAMHMLGKGYRAGWGLGRHVLGSNYFYYVRDPWGSYSEYSADIDYVPSTCDWAAGDQNPEDAFYAWGPDVPEDFAVNYEA